LYEPVRLAEEMSVLDILSGGRVSYVFGIGHRSDEYEQFGIDMRRRADLADQNLTLVRALLGGEPVLHQGRTIHVTPPPATRGGPRVIIGGGSIAAAERAGRHGLALVAQANPPGMKEAYEAACRAHGHEPQPGIYPEPGRPTAVFVADDVERAWDELGPHLLHDATTAASYRQGLEGVASISQAQSVDELREEGPYRICTVRDATRTIRDGNALQLAPLCGGIPAAVAWPYLERAAQAVERSATVSEAGGQRPR
jgi:alkanesulfonate monooxygenase SsuD/methylene tetrahydromethanopterin reductase-like flavin-dependent oxidoreductase (luciferase family)